MRLSFRSPLLLAVLILTVISVLLVNYFALEAIPRVSGTAQDQSQQALVIQAERELANINTLAAQENNHFFEEFSRQSQSIADYILLAYSQAPIKQISAANLGLNRYPGNQYATSSQSLTSVFIPGFQSFNQDTARDVISTAPLERLFAGIFSRLSGLEAIYFTTPNEVTRYYPNNNAGELWSPDYQLTSQTWYKSAIEKGIEGGPIWTTPYKGSSGDRILSTLALPVYDPSGLLLGVLGMDVNLEQVVNAVLSYDLEERGYSFLIDDQGKGVAVPIMSDQNLLILNEQTEDLGADFTQVIPDLEGIIQRMLAGQAGLESFELSGRRVLIAFSPLPNPGWSLGSVLDTSLAIQPVQPLQGLLETDFRNLVLSRINLVILATAIVFLVVVGLLVNQRMRPLSSLVTSAENIVSGQIDVDIPKAPNNEVAMVFEAFRSLRDALGAKVSSLQERLSQQEQLYERQSVQFQAVADIARDVSQNLDLSALLTQLVTQIFDRFGYYHAGVFLRDAKGDVLLLQAANSKEGAQMLSQGYRLPVDETTLVGEVAKTGRSRLAPDSVTGPLYIKNPMLADTRSQVALPLSVVDDKGEKSVIGVLDVHSKESRAFGDEDIFSLQVMADQMAAAIVHLRLLNEYQQTLQDLRHMSSRIRQESWSLFFRNQQLAGYELADSTLVPLYSEVTSSDQEVKIDQATISLPVRLRGEAVATLEIWPENGQLSEAEMHLLEEFANRLSMALESARLYEEAQSRAARERQITQIANQIRSSANLDAIMRNAVRELGLAFNANRTFIQLISATKGQESELPSTQSPVIDPGEDSSDVAPMNPPKTT